MPSTIVVTLEQSWRTNNYISFVIRGKGDLELDTIFIEQKVPRKHRDKACWAVSTHYKAQSIGDWIFRLEDFGFNTSEFEQSCIEMGWEKEVTEYHEKKER